MGETGVFESNPVIEIFELRRQSAERNLDALVDFVGSINARTASLRKLRAQLAHDRSEILSVLRRLKLHVDELRTKLDGEDYEKSDMRGPVDSTARYLSGLESAIRGARENWSSIAGLKLDPDKIKSGDLALCEQILDRKRKLEKLRTPGDDLRKRWREMDELKEFWEVSLDYLAGVSLRHDGLDLDICCIADDLICELQEYCNDLGAKTILGRDCCSTSLPQIVYLRFPEWTVWVLPLAGGELWRDVSRPVRSAGNGKLVRPTISDSYFAFAERELGKSDTARTELLIGKKKEENSVYLRWINKTLLKDCLTDIFGTFALGPAYVLSSIFLALDPSEDNDRIRAETIFSVMRTMNGWSSSFPGLANKSLVVVESAWEQAAREAGRGNGLTPEEEKKRNDQRADIAKWRDSFLTYLRNFAKLQFPIRDWEAGKDKWVDYFLSPNPSANSSNAPPNIRLALATAWEARIREPLKSRETASICKQVCEKIAETGPPPQPPEPPEGFNNSNP